MRRILAVVVAFTLAVLAACSDDTAQSAGGAPVCLADRDCSGGVCDPFRGCVDCRVSSQCGAGQLCLGGSCRAPQSCENDACPDQLHCDSGSQTCVDCLSTVDCAAGSACLNGGCQPASVCHDVKGCRPGTVCDLARAACVECLGEGDCATGERCVDQRCSARCSGHGDCSDGLRCDPLLSLCVECVAASDCAQAQHCSGGRCLLDTCVAGAGSCDAMGQAVQMCNAAGDRVLPQYCGKHASCEGEAGAAACTDWVCKPGISSCNAEGKLETCGQDGLSIEATVDCAAANQVCIGSQCVDIVCEPDSVTCDAAANALHLCSANGTRDSVSFCAVGQYCDIDLKACKTQVCTPQAEACVDNVPSVCDALGSGYDPGKSCKANQACVDGGCLPLVCDPSEQYCGDDGNAYNCNATGTAAFQTAICESPDESGAGGQSGNDYYQHCEKHGTSAACYSDPCTKGQTYCDQNQLKTCNAQGTGPVGVGQDCGADAVCQGYTPATCASKVCTPSTRFCDVAGNSVQCSADGTSSSLLEACIGGLYCDPSDAYCHHGTCTPSAAGCNGSIATTCKADGSSWVAGGTDCFLSSKVCEAGSCKAKICEPNQYFCKSGNPNLCNANGTAGTASDTCAADAYCSPGYWYCLADVCTGGQPVCADLTHLATCKADGSGPNGAGTACGANKTCDGGQCKAQVCTANSLFCNGGHVQACDGLGLSFTESQYCFADEYCKTTIPNVASCEPKVCASGTKGCNGESYGTCDALGSGYLVSPTLCTATSKLCSLTGCANSAVDVMGDQTTYNVASGSFMMGDVIYVRTTRKLTQIEVDSFSNMTGTSMHWAVYSSLAEGGPYSPAFDTITTGTAAGFQSSGVISTILTSGRYYVIGLRAGSGMFVYRNDGLTPDLSFADLLGTTQQYADPGTLPPAFSSIPQVGSWHMRVTTVLP